MCKSNEIGVTEKLRLLMIYIISQGVMERMLASDPPFSFLRLLQVVFKSELESI